MQHETTSLSQSKRFGRSAMTNGTRLLSGVDGRTKAARRFRDLVEAYCSELGTDLARLTESQRTAVRQAAGVAVQCEQMQSAIVNGDAVDPEQLVRLSNLLVRLLKNVGLGPNAGRDDEPDLSEYLAGKGKAA